ncbi:MAG: CHAT domain-containing protein, partial [Fidelibacterota bacterium]
FYITRQIAARTTKQNNLRVKRKPFKKMTMVGNPSDSKDIEKSVRNELYSISGLWEDELEISGPHFGGSTTRYRLAEFLSGCDLFHFSGHYEVQSGIKNTQDGWLLKNGTVFSAKDISNLENPPQFLFSNSCGDLSGFQNSGFIRALLSSGIRCMITTIGTVPTNQATHFSSVFYAAMQEGRPAAESVSIAKSSLVKRFGISDLSWMFYSLYGDGNLTFQFSKINLIKKYRNTIKFSIIGIGIISAIFLARSGIDIVKSREVRITSSPASIRIKVNDDIRGITPSICTVSSLDDIQLITSGYDTARYHLKKIDGKWLGVPLSAPDYILVNGQLSPTYESVEGAMHVNLIPSSLHRLRFTKVGRSKIMIQGIKGELTGRPLEIAIDSLTYRFIISKGNDGYDKQIQVTEDMVIDVSEISSTWQKNRFR